MAFIIYCICHKHSYLLFKTKRNFFILLKKPHNIVYFKPILNDDKMRTEKVKIEYKNIEDKLNQAINCGINYLHSHQLPNGEFLVYLSNDKDMQGWTLAESSSFPTTLIGNSLLQLKSNSKVSKILIEAADFLHYQMDRGGYWNHFTHVHPLRKICPLDLDDTACASHFLQKMNFKIPFKKNKQLMFDNRRRDGLFYTWIVFRWRYNKNKIYWYYASKELKTLIKSFIFWRKFNCSRYDVDMVVNSNILFYIGKDNRTKKVINYLIETIKHNQESNRDKWYRNVLTAYYFISRNIYAGITELDVIKKDIIHKTLKKQNPDGSFGESVLETALAVSSLLYSGYREKKLEKSIEYIIKTQSEYGNWDRWAFYYGAPKKPTCFGSEELTTGFCLEALTLFKDLHKHE